MNHFPQQEPVRVEHVELDRWYEADRSPDWYELILIRAGQGYYVIDENRLAYQPGDLFLLNTQQHARFLITQKTSFYRLSFSPLYVRHLPGTGSYAWNSPGSPVLSCPGPVTATGTDQENLQALITILLSERQNRHRLTDNPVIDSLMSAILSLLDRLLTRQEGGSPALPSYASTLARQIMAYISQHINEPDRLRMDALGDTFNYSPAYLSTLFKQQIGDSIQQFIIRHKLKLVAIKLRQTPLTVSQIADEFGFSDVCHLNKLFKRYYKHTPTTYRQSLSA